MSIHIIIPIKSEQPRELEGPRENIYVVNALIEYFTVLLEYIDLLGPARVSRQGKIPQLHPPASRRPCREGGG